MSSLQLDPSFPVVTPKGEGYAYILIDYGPEYNLLWVCFLDDSGECWTYDNTQIRAQKNVTMGRRIFPVIRRLTLQSLRNSRVSRR